MERRKSEETEKEPQAPVQGASGAGGSEGREDTGGVVVAVRRAPEPDHAMEESAPGASGVGALSEKTGLNRNPSSRSLRP